MSSAKDSEGASTPDFTTRDPRQAAFWDERFERGFTPWDEGHAPAALHAWLRADPPAAGTRVFVPGAGSAHEIGVFAAAGCVPYALDISAVAIRQARQALGPLGRFVEQGDAFNYMPPQPFDLLYERAFLCALPPDMHAHWGAMAQRVVRPGGALAGFFLLHDEPSAKGPPFAITRTALDALLTPHFACKEDHHYETRLLAFTGGVRWQIWHKTG
jgi:SAM-dependent methyltransferase